VSAAAIGVFLILFGLLGITEGLAFLSTRGSWVLGLSSNGLLSILSLVVGVVLVGSATRSGQLASTASIVIGVLFLLSGMGNMLVLGTSLNVLAFRLANIVFSLAVGLVLLILGAYGRISGGLPMDNPYRHVRSLPAPRAEESPAERRTNLAAAAELAQAERAAALHYATPDQLRRLELVHLYRSGEDRRRAWQESV
jgi:hypothetical protein